MDVPCVAYYRATGHGATPDARQIGEGINQWPPLRPVAEHLLRLYQVLLDQRVAEYDSDQSIVERGLLASLVGRYTGVAGLDADHVALFNGTTELISVVTAYAARLGLRPVLPLPVYYAFEQSARRHHLPAPVHYNGTGDFTRYADPAQSFFVDVAPNGVTGTWSGLPAPLCVPAPALRLVDHVFALPTFQDPKVFQRELRQRAHGFRDTAICLTPSKDLSIPGIRCGVLVSKAAGLQAYVRADRFERGYSVHMALASVAAMHLALVQLSLCGANDYWPLVRELRADFTMAHVPFPDDDGLTAFGRGLAAAKNTFLRNLDVIGNSPLFAPGAFPVAGFSTFRALAARFDSAEAYTSWIAAAAAAGLELNPNYLYGGDADIWQRLYPGMYGIRINISVPTDRLRLDLRALEELVP